ncbi:MAG: hypothetical protein NZV14_08020 [Bryobacteraceae bacterium]|nr:hypothetical protein [Bryobacteraceae bacterium]MDW8378093.1 hypothetical protein [Bryobacterales bacterium]
MKRRRVVAPKKRGKALREEGESKVDVPSPQEVVEKLLKKFSEKLEKGGDVTLTVNDFVRLLQLQKELMQQAPREIEVRWLENIDCKSSEET